MSGFYCLRTTNRITNTNGEPPLIYNQKGAEPLKNFKKSENSYLSEYDECI